MILNMRDFILELGRDFTFIDAEYKVQVVGEDYAIDYSDSLIIPILAQAA